MYNRYGYDYTELPNSRSQNKNTITVILQTKKNYGWYLLDTWRDGAYCQPVPDDLKVGGWLDLDACAVQPAEAYDTVTLVLQKKKPEIYWSTSDRSDPVYVPSSTPLELPLERAPNYLAKWNNDLFLQTPEGDLPTDPPNQWNTLKHPDVFTADGYTWSIAPQSPGDGWKLFLPRTKPGQETFLFFSGTITETIFFRSLKKASQAQLLTGILAVPGFTGIFPATVGKWLVQSSSVTESGDDLYALTTVYLYAPGGWDTDIYTHYA